MKERYVRAEEHPYCDRLQNTMVPLFFVIWGLDSFFLKMTTFLDGSVPFPVRGVISLTLVVFGVYMSWNSHEAIFGGESSHAVIDWGAYSLCRHPMYLGIVSLLLGLSFASFSIASFFISAVLMVLYDRFASYEEEQLIKLYGEYYREYQRRVPKWVPKFW
ncbi:MAG: isoprenylcysteine carboxylmethyltransferase family protein [Candidatus Bathyarchaeota archaeon]